MSGPRKGLGLKETMEERRGGPGYGYGGQSGGDMDPDVMDRYRDWSVRQGDQPGAFGPQRDRARAAYLDGLNGSDRPRNDDEESWQAFRAGRQEYARRQRLRR